MSDNEEMFLFHLRVLAKDPKSITNSMQREYRFYPPRRWRLDFAWPNEKICVEIDGIAKQAGGGKHNYDADREKLNYLALTGWLVLRFSSMQLKTNPEKCIKMVCYLINKKRGVLDA